MLQLYLSDQQFYCLLRCLILEVWWLPSFVTMRSIFSKTRVSYKLSLQTEESKGCTIFFASAVTRFAVIWWPVSDHYNILHMTWQLYSVGVKYFFIFASTSTSTQKTSSTSSTFSIKYKYFGNKQQHFPLPADGLCYQSQNIILLGVVLMKILQATFLNTL